MFRSPADTRLIGRLCVIPPFAHHPTCSCFNKHLIRIGPISLCLGCSCLSAGLVIGSALLSTFAVFDFDFTLKYGWLWTLLAGTILYLPTLGQPWLQWRLYKIIARTLLGVGVIFLWFGALLLMPIDMTGLMLRICFFLIFFGVACLTLRLRKLYTPDPSKGCPKGGFPFCTENLKRLTCVIDDATQPTDEAEQMLAKLLENSDTSLENPISLEIVSANDLYCD